MRSSKRGGHCGAFSSVWTRFFQTLYNDKLNVAAILLQVLVQAICGQKDGKSPAFHEDLVKVARSVAIAGMEICKVELENSLLSVILIVRFLKNRPELSERSRD
ncbi:hypothetical protein [Thalassoglobus neptunius]|uniref:hypothetical protein n=1 Tax=Thalassoglobus neptunius TaxID=1938619 RepID=UPI0011B47162|nr:hypothetical protein [Thalassoglobus neptunius]